MLTCSHFYITHFTFNRQFWNHASVLQVPFYGTCLNSRRLTILSHYGFNKIVDQKSNNTSTGESDEINIVNKGIYELEIAFSDLDNNNDNYICKDLKFWGQELEQTHSDLQIDEKISKFQPTVEGRIDFGEFIDVMSHKMKNPFLPNDLMESFVFCDYDNKGYLTLLNLSRSIRGS